jgi:hypothetical protein
MKRLSWLAAALTAAVAVAVVLAAAGGIQTPGGRTLTFLDDTDHATQAFVDRTPKSPVRNPRSARFRLSTGDTLYVRTPAARPRGRQANRNGLPPVHGRGGR